MFKELVQDKMGEMVSAVTSSLGVDETQATGFVAQTIDMIENLVGSGNLEVSKLASGDFSELTSKLDLATLGSLIGGGNAAAERGLNALAGPLKSKLESAGGAADLLGKLGGMGNLFGN